MSPLQGGHTDLLWIIPILVHVLPKASADEISINTRARLGVRRLGELKLPDGQVLTLVPSRAR